MRGVMQYAELYKDITKENLIEFKQRMIEKYSPKTVNLRITAVLRYCDYKEIYMTYTQLSLIGIDAIVVQGDTLLEPYTDNYPRSRVFRTLRNMGGLI